MMQVTQQKNNEAIAFIFQQMALCYRYLGGEQFRAAAYEKAATMLLNMQEDIAVYASDIKRLEAMGNIGVSIAKKITEYLQTGRIELFARLKKRVPYALLGLMDITGFGPATIRLLYNQCGIKDEEELVKALNSHRLDDVKGLGKRRVARMKVLLALTERGQLVLLKDGCRIGAALVAILRKVPGVQQAELCGSIR